MIPRGTRPYPLLLALLCLLPAVAAAPAREKAAATEAEAQKPVPATVQSIMAAPRKWAGRRVQVNGTVAHFQAKTSRRGNAYTVFDLMAPDGKTHLAVFSFGDQRLTDSARVRVRGVFLETRKVGTKNFHNEIDASKPKGSVEELK